MCKEVERVARLYYCDHADEYELDVSWAQLPERQKQHWRDFAQRRLERDS